MKGGVTHSDMDERREALAFVRWMATHVPETLDMLRESFRRSVGPTKPAKAEEKSDARKGDLQ